MTLRMLHAARVLSLGDRKMRAVPSLCCPVAARGAPRAELHGSREDAGFSFTPSAS
jgi:hypothetical protein